MFQLTRGPARGSIGRSLRRLSIFPAACALALAQAAPLLAQAQKTAAAEPAAEGGSWPIVDWLIVVVLIGGAIYVICRSSRRN
jgi:hypothetical protein